MSRIPLLRQRGVLFVSLPEDVDDQSAQYLLSDILSRIEQNFTTGVIVDVSSLAIVDSFLGRIIADIANCTAVMDAKTVICGVQPAVAITLIELGMEFPRVSFSMDIESALDEMELAQ